MSWDESGRLDKEFDEDGSVIISGDNSVSNGDVSTEEGNILKKVDLLNLFAINDLKRNYVLDVI